MGHNSVPISDGTLSDVGRAAPGRKGKRIIMLTTIKNILTALPLLKKFLALWDEVATAVHQVEQPGVSGADKKALALKTVSDLCNGFAQFLALQVPTASIVNIVGILIDSVVYVENALGRFKHAAPAVVTATSAAVLAPTAPLPNVQPRTVVTVAPVPPAAGPAVEVDDYDIMAGTPGKVF